MESLPPTTYLGSVTTQQDVAVCLNLANKDYQGFKGLCRLETEGTAAESPRDSKTGTQKPARAPSMLDSIL